MTVQPSHPNSRVFFSIRPPPGLLPVLGLLKWYMTPIFDAALLYTSMNPLPCSLHAHITHVCRAYIAGALATIYRRPKRGFDPPSARVS